MWNQSQLLETHHLRSGVGASAYRCAVVYCTRLTWPAPLAAHRRENSSPPALKVELYRPLTLDSEWGISAKMKQKIYYASALPKHIIRRETVILLEWLFSSSLWRYFRKFLLGSFQKSLLCHISALLIFGHFQPHSGHCPITAVAPRWAEPLPQRMPPLFLTRIHSWRPFCHLISILCVPLHYPVTFHFFSWLLSRP